MQVILKMMQSRISFVSKPTNEIDQNTGLLTTTPLADQTQEFR